jgi:predicted outer membrane repeat protein
MKLGTLVILLIGMEFILSNRCKSETYYVKPSEDAECPGQPCETLQSFIDTLGFAGYATIESQNTTLVLLNGTHTMSTGNAPWLTFTLIFRSVIGIRGEKNHNVIVEIPDDEMDPLWFILQGSRLHMENLNLDVTPSIGVYDCSNSSIRSEKTLSDYCRDCSMFPGWYDCPSYDGGMLQVSSVNLILSRQLVVSVSQQAHFNSCTVYQGFIFFVYTDYAIFCNTTLYDNSRISATNSKVIFINSSSLYDSEVIVMSGSIELSQTNVFAYISGSAIKCYKSNITIRGCALFANNSGAKGAALALYSSNLKLGNGTNLIFINNLASRKGGAIYIEPGLSPFVYVTSFNSYFQMPDTSYCFYELLDCSSTSTYTVYFENNSAYFGGDDMYGARFHSLYCMHYIDHQHCKVTVIGASSNISSVSSDATRVCLCDDGGVPQRGWLVLSLNVTSGEVFTIRVALVDNNYGTTTGTLNVYSTYAEDHTPFTIKPGDRSPINSKECTELNYSLYTNYTYITLDLYLAADFTHAKYGEYFGGRDLDIALVHLRVAISPCPSGFLLIGDPPGCECYHSLCNNHVLCTIVNGNGLFSWNGSQIWVASSAENGITCNEFCPVDYCNFTGSWIDTANDPDAQCAYNRGGRLCGGCKENYSLAIGSSRCIYCPNSNNLALLLFFLLAGVVLVLFITALNFTVAHNAISGLIFYANIVWIYQNIFFPKHQETNHTYTPLMIFLKTFIAWMNLDFGIETCFVHGLTAFWKQWLQFIFPFYIWFIVGMIVIAARRSTKITALLPQKRIIPVLATVFLLSYIKLVGIISSALKFSFILEYPNDTIKDPKPTTTAVWSVDGNLTYCGHPHIFLFLAGLATLLFLWLPYTLLTFSMQWLRVISHLRFLTWIERFVPISDANTAPLKHKHQYWFGVLLLARGILLLIATSSFGIPYGNNLLILLVFATLLLFYTNLMQVYKNSGNLLLDSSFNINLIILSGVFILTSTQPHSERSQMIAVGISTGCAFLQFCGIVLYMLIKQYVPRICTNKPANEDHYIYRLFDAIDIN